LTATQFQTITAATIMVTRTTALAAGLQAVTPSLGTRPIALAARTHAGGLTNCLPSTAFATLLGVLGDGICRIGRAAAEWTSIITPLGISQRTANPTVSGLAF
jgi:hypothetical protein